MCGEIDETIAIGHDLLEQLKVMSGMLGVTFTEDETMAGGPRNLESAEGRAAYMETLFQAGLRRSLADGEAAEAEAPAEA